MPSVNQWPIIQEGVDALSELDHALGRVLAHAPEDLLPGEHLIIPAAYIRPQIEKICGSQARAFGCLFDSGERRGENEELAASRLARVEKVRTYTKGMHLPNLTRKAVRNVLAHSDEHYLKALIREPVPKGISWVALSSRKAFEANIFIGVYFFAEDEFQIFDEILKLRAMRIELEQLFDAIGVDWKAGRAAAQA